MKFFTFILLAIFSSVLAAPLVDPSNEIRSNDLFADEDAVRLHCDTSPTSPLTGDILTSATKLFRKPGFCQQDNSHGENCTMLVKSESASVGICGDNAPVIQCALIGRLVLELTMKCAFLFGDGRFRAGGKVAWGHGNTKIVLYQSPKA